MQKKLSKGFFQLITKSSQEFKSRNIAPLSKKSEVYVKTTPVPNPDKLTTTEHLPKIIYVQKEE